MTGYIKISSASVGRGGPWLRPPRGATAPQLPRRGRVREREGSLRAGSGGGGGGRGRVEELRKVVASPRRAAERDFSPVPAVVRSGCAVSGARTPSARFHRLLHMHLQFTQGFILWVRLYIFLNMLRYTQYSLLTSTRQHFTVFFLCIHSHLLRVFCSSHFRSACPFIETFLHIVTSFLAGSFSNFCCQPLTISLKFPTAQHLSGIPYLTV